MCLSTFLPTNSPDKHQGYAWPDGDAFLVSSIESDLTPWVPVSQGTEFARLPSNDFEDTPLDGFMPPGATSTWVSTASTCASSQWQDQDGSHDFRSLSPLSGEPHTHFVGTSNFPMSDEEFESFFGQSTPNSCSSDSSSSPSPQMLDDNDVVFISCRKTKAIPNPLPGPRPSPLPSLRPSLRPSPRPSERPNPGQTRREEQRRRERRKIVRSKAPTRSTGTEWNDVLLHVGLPSMRSWPLRQKP